jgi:hypothetical protein
VGARGGLCATSLCGTAALTRSPHPHARAPPQILIDHKSEKAGSLLTDFAPPFIPPTEIDDPADAKPADWVDEAKIADVTDAKPEDWDEDAPRLIDDEAAVKPAAWADDAPAMIADPKASKPADWNDEDDGAYEAPLVPNPACEAAGCGAWKRPQKANPAYKGKWAPRLVDNPAYKGVWAPRKIANVAHFATESIGTAVFAGKSCVGEGRGPARERVGSDCDGPFPRTTRLTATPRAHARTTSPPTPASRPSASRRRTPSSRLTLSPSSSTRRPSSPPSRPRSCVDSRAWGGGGGRGKLAGGERAREAAVL